jgi:hypothetical protein
VHLGDARLGDAEDLADLAEREVLVVVEGDDELLALGELGDGLGDAVLEVADVECARGVGRAGVVSISETWSPLESETLQSSSRATMEECEMVSSESLSSSTVMPTSSAISLSVGARWSLFSSLALARSSSRARARTLRGTQSIARSSSMMAPLMRMMAYVSNLISRERSKRSMAEMSPTMP